MHARTKRWVGAVVVVLGALVARRFVSQSTNSKPVAGSIDPTTHGDGAAAIQSPAPLESATAAAPSATVTELADAGPRVLFTATWGSGIGKLGRDRPQEGNPEGPMSLVRAGRDLLVLDQVNGRLARYDESGRLKGTSPAPTTAQDLAVGKDGTVAMIDRLVGKSVTLVDGSGRKIGELPLDSRFPEPGLVTAVVIDGKDVYAEKEHGALLLVGTTDGVAATAAGQLSGRPSKDGALLVTAGFSSKPNGRAYVNAVDRQAGSLRFAAEVGFPRPSLAIVLLDTDARGTIYLGVAAGDPASATVACLSEADGHVLGRVTLPLSQTAEEAFRDFTVGDDGTIIFAVRSDDGVEYRSATCP